METQTLPRPRRRARRALALGLALAAALASPAPAQQHQGAPPRHALAPPTGADPQVQRGYYLMRMGDCVSCHTAPGGKPFAGGLRLDTPFGPMLSANITPDGATGIGRWSADDFWRALHDGVNKDGQYLYPVMPYTFYTKVTRADSDALYAYLRSVPAVRNAVETNQLWFPYDIRLGQLVWRELFFTEGTYQPQPAKGEAWNRGAYLVEGLGHCGACHSPRSVLGGIEPGQRFTGAGIDGWFAPNITSNIRYGLGRFTVDELTKWLRQGEVQTTAQLDLNAVNPFGYSQRGYPVQSPTAVGPMAEVWHNSLRFLTERDAHAIATYLLDLPPNSSLMQPATQTPPDRNPMGALLYAENCSGCHMPNGQGGVGAAAPLAGNPMVLAPSPDNVLAMVIGGQKPHDVMGAMPSFSRELSNAQVAAVATFVRSRWGNNASAVTPEQVAAYRARYFPGASNQPPAALQAPSR